MSAVPLAAARKRVSLEVCVGPLSDIAWAMPPKKLEPQSQGNEDVVDRGPRITLTGRHNAIALLS